MNPKDRLEFLYMDLERAWDAVAEVQGPELGDARAPLADRSRAFSARITTFRREMAHE